MNTKPKFDKRILVRDIRDLLYFLTAANGQVFLAAAKECPAERATHLSRASNELTEASRSLKHMIDLVA
jgi:hypothetical protein